MYDKKRFRYSFVSKLAMQVNSLSYFTGTLGNIFLVYTHINSPVLLGLYRYVPL